MNSLIFEFNTYSIFFCFLNLKRKYMFDVMYYYGFWFFAICCVKQCLYCIIYYCLLKRCVDSFTSRNPKVVIKDFIEHLDITYSGSSFFWIELYSNTHITYILNNDIILKHIICKILSQDPIVDSPFHMLELYILWIKSLNVTKVCK